MAIIPIDQYQSQIIVSDPGWPHGRPQNDSVPGDGSGTPLEEAWVSDLFGFQQALLGQASITPSGAPDKVGGSQYLDALNALFAEKSVETRMPDMPRGNPTFRQGFMPAGMFNPSSASAWSRYSARWESNGTATSQLIGSMSVPVGFKLEMVTLAMKAPLHGESYPPSTKVSLTVRRNNVFSDTQGTIIASGFDLAEQSTYEAHHKFTKEILTNNEFLSVYEELEVSINGETGTNALAGVSIYGVLLYGSMNRGRVL